MDQPGGSAGSGIDTERPSAGAGALAGWHEPGFDGDVLAGGLGHLAGAGLFSLGVTCLAGPPVRVGGVFGGWRGNGAAGAFVGGAGLVWFPLGGLSGLCGLA